MVKDGTTDVSGIYLNGNLIASRNDSFANLLSITTLVIGENYRGKIDDVALFSDALSAQTISDLYAARGGTSLPDNSLIKTGSGTATLTGNNTNSGTAVTVAQGTLNANSAGALGANPQALLTVSGTGTTLNLYDNASALTSFDNVSLPDSGSILNTRAGKLQINHQLQFFGGTTATISGAPSFTVQGTNLANDSVPGARQFNLNGGTLTVNSPLDLVSGVSATSSDNYYAPRQQYR